MDRLTDRVCHPDKAEVTREGGDNFFTVVDGAFPHDGAEDLDEFVGFVIGHADGPGTDMVGAVRSR